MGMAATIPYYTVEDLEHFPLGVHEVWLVDKTDRSVEVSRVPGTHETVRDAMLWRVPTLDLDVAVDLSAVFAGIE